MHQRAERRAAGQRRHRRRDRPQRVVAGRRHGAGGVRLVVLLADLGLAADGGASCAARVSALYDVRRQAASTVRPSAATANAVGDRRRRRTTAPARRAADLDDGQAAVEREPGQPGQRARRLGHRARRGTSAAGSAANSSRCSGAHSVLRALGAHHAMTWPGPGSGRRRAAADPRRLLGAVACAVGGEARRAAAADVAHPAAGVVVEQQDRLRRACTGPTRTARRRSGTRAPCWRARWPPAPPRRRSPAGGCARRWCRASDSSHPAAQPLEAGGEAERPARPPRAAPRRRAADR